MTNLQAAIGLAQLESLKKHLNRKREIGLFYMNAFKSVKEFILPPCDTSYANNGYWVFGIILSKKPLNGARNYILKNLKASQIGARPFFWPIHKQPVFKKLNMFMGEKYPVADMLSKKGFLYS